MPAPGDSRTLKLGPIELGRATVLALHDCLPAAVGFARALASTLNLDEDELTRLEVAVEEACLNVVEHAYPGEETGDYDVIVERLPVQLRLAIVDRGLPLEPGEVGSGVGSRLMRAFADEVHYTNLGKSGKRVELIRQLPYRNLESYLSLASAPEEAPSDQDTPLDCHLMSLEEAPRLARCVYRSYGYSYAADTVYYPEKVQDLMALGLMTSAIACTDDGEVVGHMAVNRSSLDERVPDCGQAIVDPRFRGRGLFHELKRLLIDHARSQGFYGLYSEAVTLHPYTQKGNTKLGAVETGVQLAYVPASLEFRKIEAHVSQRQAVMLTYLKVCREPERIVFLPQAHRAIIEQIYDRLQMRRIMLDESEAPADTGTAELQVVARLDWGFGMLRTKGGLDLARQVRLALRELRNQNLKVCYLELPLGHPSTARQVPELESLGFFFAGLIPELRNGDILRMQYLDGVEVEPERILTASEQGARMLKYVLDAYQASLALQP